MSDGRRAANQLLVSRYDHGGCRQGRAPTTKQRGITPTRSLTLRARNIDASGLHRHAPLCRSSRRRRRRRARVPAQRWRWIRASGVTRLQAKNSTSTSRQWQQGAKNVGRKPGGARQQRRGAAAAAAAPVLVDLKYELARRSHGGRVLEGCSFFVNSCLDASDFQWR